MFYPVNPATTRMWSAADRHLPGSGQQLERWALAELEKAVAGGQLDPRNSSQVQGFLGSLGITPQKGGGRFLYNKLMQPGGAISGLVARGGSGMSSSSGMGSSSMGADPMAMGRKALQNKYGTHGTLGTIGDHRPGLAEFDQTEAWG